MSYEIKFGKSKYKAKLKEGKEVNWNGEIMTIKDCFLIGSKHEYRFKEKEGFFREADILVQNKNYDVHLNGSCEHEWMNSRLTLQGKSLKVCLKCRRTEQTVC